MAFVEPVTLRGAHVALEPLAREHEAGLKAAAADGELWQLWYTSVPTPDKTLEWIDAALDMRAKLGALPFVVREPATNDIVGSTRYFNVDPRAPAARDRPHVVREARPAHGAQHRSEAPAAHARVRERSTASPSSSARASSTSRRARRSRGSARSRTASCAITSGCRTGRSATPSSSASSRPNGRP